MNPVFKILVRLAAAVILLPIIAVLVFFFIISPNRYQESLQDIAIKQTGLDVSIAGEVAWTFRPTFGLTISDVRVNDNQARRELASASKISLPVAPRDLLRGNLVVQEMRIDGLHVNWFTNADGQNNWSLSSIFNSESPGSGEQTTNDRRAWNNSNIDTPIDRITLSNATIDIQNLQRNYHLSLENLHLTSSNGNIKNRQFPIAATFQLVNHTGKQALNLTLATKARIDYLTGNAQFDALRINLNPMELQGSFSLRNFRHDPIWFSSLSSNTFILGDFLDNFRDPEAQQNAVLTAPSFPVAERGQTSLQIQINGDQQKFSIPALQLNIDEMNIESEANLRYATNLSPTNLSYSVTTNTLDLSPWLGSNDPGNLMGIPSGTSVINSNSKPQAAENAIEIPKEFLTGINIQASHNLESIVVNEHELTPVNVFVNLEGGILNLEAQPMEISGGTIQGTVQLDSRSHVALLTSQISASAINIIDLAAFYPKLQSLKGLVDLESSYSMAGNTVNAMLENISGSSAFNLKQNSIDIAIFKQVFTAISALSPTGDAIQQWPDIIQFGELSGYLLINEGLEENQQLKIRMDNFDIDGRGGINFTDETFTYDFLFTVLGDASPQTIRINPSYHDISWPVQCAASFSDLTSQYCRPDFPKVRDLFLNLPDNDSQADFQPGSQPPSRPQSVEQFQSEDANDNIPDSLLDNDPDPLLDNVPDPVFNNNFPEELPDAAKQLLRNLFPQLTP